MSGIRIDHTHDDTGKRCYAMGQGLEQAGLFGSEENLFAVAYRPYTGHWYAWNINTGEQIATFTRAFL